MHGRPRQAPSAASKEELAKIAQYNKHRNSALVAYKNRIFSPATLALTSAILAINPDLNTLFNYRKEQLMDSLLKNYFDNNNDYDTIKKLYQTELDLATTALRKNPKSYHAWYHRIWCLEHGLLAIDLKNEFLLTEKYLSQDSRNFHCWNYRRYIARIAMGLESPYNTKNRSPGEIQNEENVLNLLCVQQKRETILTTFPPIVVPAEHVGKLNYFTTMEKELYFTQKMIEQDFSNFSAWHYRSILLPVVLMRKVISPPSDPQTTTDQQFEEYYGINKKKIVDFNLTIPKQFTTTTTSFPLSASSFVNNTELYTQVLQHITTTILMYISFDLCYINIALSMSPQDQSPWFYQRWLLAFIQTLLYPKPLERCQYFTPRKVQNIPEPETLLDTKQEDQNIIEYNNNNKDKKDSIIDVWTDEDIKLLQSFPILTYIPQNDTNITHYIDMLSKDRNNDGQSNDNTNQKYGLFASDIINSLFTKFEQSPQTHNITQKQQDTPSIMTFMMSNKTVLNITTFLNIIDIELQTLYINNTTLNNNSNTNNDNNDTTNNQDSTTTTQITLPTTLQHELQIVQLDLLQAQYKYYTQDLLSLILDGVDVNNNNEEQNTISNNNNNKETFEIITSSLSPQQYNESRLTLLSIVILSLSIEYVLNIHQQYAILDKINAQKTKVLRSIYNNQQYLTSRRILETIVSQELPLTRNVGNTIQYLANSDSHRADYYFELFDFYTRAHLYSTAAKAKGLDTDNYTCDDDDENYFDQY